MFHWFDNGRPYAWEGVDCCPGTCTHVWHYAQGLSRVFPALERAFREQVDFKAGVGFNAGVYTMQHREIEKAFRWYAMPGEAGLLMCTWPKGGAKDAIPGDQLRPEKNPEVWTGPGGYFNECMNGFEYQAAWHMIAEGGPGSALVQQGLAIMKTIHERYGAAKRNPYNEIECSDHYARSMASYGIYLAASGYHYHGPRGHLGFAPRLHPDDFKAAFTAAEGWGTFTQTRGVETQTALIEIQWGQLDLKSLAFHLPAHRTVDGVQVLHAGRPIHADHRQDGQRIRLVLDQEIGLRPNQRLEIRMSLGERE